MNKIKDYNGGGDMTRRGFLSGLLAVGSAVLLSARDKLTDGGLAPLTEKKHPKREIPLVPPGSISVKNFYTHCTACQLCIAACPNGLLKPSGEVDRFMQPVMSYDNGYCRPECTRCSQICPTGAIRSITESEKTDISIGQARVDIKNCLAANGIAPCGVCERHCPVQVITMMKLDSNDGSGLLRRRPVVSEHRCIGCGACENSCPVNPVSAIRVVARIVHTEIS